MYIVSSIFHDFNVLYILISYTLQKVLKVDDYPENFLGDKLSREFLFPKVL